MTKQLTMKETLEMLIEEGIGKHEKQLERVKKVGRLNAKKQVEAVERSLEQLYKDFTIEKGTGKSAVVYLGNKRDTIVERVDGRENNTYALSEDEKNIMETIYKEIHFLDHRQMKADYTIGYWVQVFGFPFYSAGDYKDSIDKMANKISSVYTLDDSVDFFNSKLVAREFLYNFNERAKNIVQKSFERLDKKGLITYTQRHRGMTNDDMPTSIKEEDYKAFKKEQSDLIKQSGYTHIQYMQMLSVLQNYSDSVASNTLKQFQKVHEKIEQQLVQKYGVKFVFMTHSVELEVEDDYVTDTAAPEYKQRLMYDFYLERTKKYRYKNYKQNYAQSSYFYRAFFYLTASILLDRTDRELMERFESDLKAYVLRYDMAHGLNVRHKENIPFTDEDRIKLSNKDRVDFWKSRALIKQRKETKMELKIEEKMEEYYGKLDSHFVEQVEETDEEKKLKKMYGVPADISWQKYKKQQQDINDFNALFATESL